MITSTSTPHVLNNRLGYLNQLTKLYLLNQTIYQLSPVTINSKQTKPFANGTVSAVVCAFGQSKTFARTSIKKYVPSPCHEASHINWPCTNNLSSLLASARMPVVDQNHQMTLQASLQHCCQVNVSHSRLIDPGHNRIKVKVKVEWNPWDSVGVCITESSDRCVHKVAQPTHVAER